MIETKKLCKTFSNGGLQVHVIKNLDLSIQQGDFTIIMGNSGSGKSTLLYALSGMDRPTLGEINCFGEAISTYDNDGLARFRRKNCGFIFQSIHLIESMSVMDNLLASGLLLTRHKKYVYSRAASLLEQVNIGRELWNKFPSQLSGGEAQRVGVARALVNHPRILFADEPTGALNAANSKAVLDIMTDIHKEGQSIVMVTHDLKTSIRGNRILYLRDGSVSGELSLKPYHEQSIESRMETVQVFLTEMGW